MSKNPKPHEPFPLNDDAVYTPDQVSRIINFSANFVRGQIKEKKMVGFRVGNRRILVRGREVKAWLQRWENSGLGSTGEITPPSGTKGKDVGDIALESLLRNQRM